MRYFLFLIAFAVFVFSDLQAGTLPKFAINMLQELAFYDESETLIHSLPSGTVKQAIAVGQEQVEVFFGKNIGGGYTLMLVASQKNADGIAFKLGGADVFMAPGTMLNSKISQDGKSIQVQRGPIAGVEINGSPLDQEYTIRDQTHTPPASSSVALPASGETQQEVAPPQMTSEDATAPEAVPEISASEQPPAPSVQDASAPTVQAATESPATTEETPIIIIESGSDPEESSAEPQSEPSGDSPEIVTE